MRTFRNKVALTAGLLVFTSVGQARDEKLDETIPVTVITKAEAAKFSGPGPDSHLVTIVGQPVRMVWDDGRQAILLEDFVDFNPRADLVMSANTCVKVDAPKCHIEANFKNRRFRYVWEIYPGHGERIGKTLKRIRDPEDKDYNNVTALYWMEIDFISQSTQIFERNLGLNSPPVGVLRDRIVCDRFDWLPAGPEIVVPKWLSQFEYPNLEMGATGPTDDDPQSVSSYTSSLASVRLRHLDLQTYEVMDAKNVSSGYNFFCSDSCICDGV